MIKRNFTIAIRHFWRNRITTAINVLGLAIGISAALVIYLIIRHEYSYEQRVPNNHRIYRVVTNGADWKNSGVQAPLPEHIKNEVSGITSVAHLLDYDGWSPNVKIPTSDGQQSKLFKKEKGLVFADENYFNLFPHKWLAGNENFALKAPMQAVISKSKLQQYYPGLTPSEALGKTIIVSDTISMTISGVVSDMEGNTAFEKKLVFSLASVKVSPSLGDFFSYDRWNSISDVSQCLVLLASNAQAQQVEKQINQLADRFIEREDGEGKEERLLQPLSDVHFNKDFNYSAVEKSTLRNLSLLAIFLVLLGAINFINLSTAQSIERAKEIGVRKTLGSGKWQLVSQFLTETFLITLFATCLSVLISPMIFKAFSGFVPKEMNYSDMLHGHVVGYLAVLTLIISFIAGFYPAWVLTSYQPIEVLKNQLSKNSSKSRTTWIRQGLTVFQFVIAQVFMIGVLVISRQIDFAKNKDMGFKKDAIITFMIPDFMDPSSKKKFLLRDELQRIPEIEAVSLGNQSPAMGGSMSNGLSYKEGDVVRQLQVDARNGDTSYLKVYQIPLVAGRNVHLPDSGREMIINESMVKLLGLNSPQEALGKVMDFGDPTPIVGVMKDFNIASLRTPIRPLMYWSDNKRGYMIHVAFRSSNTATWHSGIEKIEQVWKQLYPENDFDYSFFDKHIENFYLKDMRLSNLLHWAMGLAITIACMGLVGLGIFTANQRTKEIGIRKVLGASVAQIIVLLLKGLLALVIVACLIAFPIAAYFTQRWLEDFAYHIDLSWTIFAMTALGMLSIALLVLSIKAYRAANANPVESLRDE
ncbi:ABC transporter permease [Olivibacter sitiensis]|uniref:ABC transporter permease n=1 Tax=Olivibacter sitiensis TaxID=376470 RepID=UPI000429320B|nr:ABC transporter permease [Olivibacter sitiensis]